MEIIQLFFFVFLFFVSCILLDQHGTILKGEKKFCSRWGGRVSVDAGGGVRFLGDVSGIGGGCLWGPLSWVDLHAVGCGCPALVSARWLFDWTFGHILGFLDRPGHASNLRLARVCLEGCRSV